jgi:anti-sigma factor RsiW
MTMTMTACEDMRPLLPDHAAGRLAEGARGAVAAHLERCEACRQALAVETALGDALQRLPRHRAPATLRRRVESLLAAASPPAPAPPSEAAAARAPAAAARPRARLRAWAAPLAAACASAAAVFLVMRPPAAPRLAPDAPAGALVSEAVNDHLRVVQSAHPAEIESGGIHQVKPWFTGKLDFAPRVAFAGDDEFPLTGGSLGYFRDRKAAVFLFKRRLHAITLLVFPPEGLPWPSAPARRLGGLDVVEETSRGFSVLLWREQGLGYALVSDVNAADLERLAAKINAPEN